MLTSAYIQIQSDQGLGLHCIGFTSDKAKSEELCSILTEMDIEHFQDEIPYYGINHRLQGVVLGCDIKKTMHLKERFQTEK